MTNKNPFCIHYTDLIHQDQIALCIKNYMNNLSFVSDNRIIWYIQLLQPANNNF